MRIMKNLIVADTCKYIAPGEGRARFRGTKYIQGYGVGTSIHWSCPEGYLYVGNSDAVCLDGGRWSKQVGYCKSKPCLLFISIVCRFFFFFLQILNLILN